MNPAAEAIINSARARLATDSYHEFVKQAFAVLEPGTEFADNWHIQFLCNTIQAVVHRVGQRKAKKRDLIINIPPRSLKSYIATICITPWAWLHYPHLKFLASSYSSDLSTDHSVMARQIIESSWYQGNWGNRYQMMPDQNQKTKYKNTKMGKRNAVSTGGTVTGKGGDIIIMDDPQDPLGANSDVDRETTIKFFTDTLSSRLDDPKTGIFILVQQRLHVNDLTGYLLTREGEEKWQHVCLPAEEAPNVKPEKLRPYYRDGLLFPDRFSKEVLQSLYSRLGSRQAAGQYGQSPKALEGNIIKGMWFKRFKWADLPSKFLVNFYVDTAYTDDTENDPCGILAFTVVDGFTFILGFVKRWMEFPAFCNFLLSYTLEMGRTDASRIWVEPKASGKSIVQELKKIPGVGIMEDEPPSGSKVERAHAVTPALESGKVFLPERDDRHYGGQWIDDFIENNEAFPNLEHDEETDCLTGAIRKSKPSAWEMLANRRK